MVMSTEKAVKVILGLIDTPILDTTESPGYIFQHIYGIDDIYHMLSSGEKCLADLALSIHQGKFWLGGMDRENRKSCLNVLDELYGYPFFLPKELNKND